MNNKSWNDRADKDLFFTILSVKNIGVISGAEWSAIGLQMRYLGYGFTNEGCRQHFQGLRRAQIKEDTTKGVIDPLPSQYSRRIDPNLNPITRRPGPGRGRPKKQKNEEGQGVNQDSKTAVAPAQQTQPEAQNQQQPIYPQMSAGPLSYQQHYHSPPPQSQAQHENQPDLTTYATHDQQYAGHQAGSDDGQQQPPNQVEESQHEIEPNSHAVEDSLAAAGSILDENNERDNEDAFEQGPPSKRQRLESNGLDHDQLQPDAEGQDDDHDEELNHDEVLAQALAAHASEHSDNPYPTDFDYEDS